jgi:flagellar biosynthesis GTPase FlhF
MLQQASYRKGYTVLIVPDNQQEFVNRTVADYKAELLREKEAEEKRKEAERKKKEEKRRKIVERREAEEKRLLAELVEKHGLPSAVTK